MKKANKKKADKNIEKPNLLDLFIISNVPSSTTFKLFCRFLTFEDVHDYEYFEESQVENFDLPLIEQVDNGYFDELVELDCMNIAGTSLVQGFKFGVYDSYEDALSAAKSYTAESLLEKYFAVYEAAKDKSVKGSTW